MLAVGYSSKKSMIVLARLSRALGVRGLLGSAMINLLGDTTQVGRCFFPFCARLRELLLIDVVSKADKWRVGVSAGDVEPSDAVRFVRRRTGGPDARSANGLPSALDPLPKVLLVRLWGTFSTGQDALP